MNLAFRHLTPWLFPNHPYGYYQLGLPEKVAAFTQDDIRAFWEQQIKQPWVLAVCGSFDRDEVLALARRLPAPQAQRPDPGVPGFTAEREKTLHLAERNQAHLMLIFPTVGRRHADTPGLELMQEILAGQSGLLFRDLRDEHGLGYSVTAWNWQALETGFMAFYIGTEPDKLAAAQQGFERIIDELRATPLVDEELLRGKNQMSGNYYRDHQRLGSRSSEAATLTALGLGQDYNREVIERARGLGPEDLRALAVRYLLPEKAMTFVVVP